MTFAEAQTYVSRSLQDQGTDRLWSTTLIAALVNQGCQDVARRTGFTKRWVSFVSDPAEAGGALYVPDLGYTLDEVFHLQTDKGPLCRSTVEELMAADDRWLEATGGEPTDYALGYKLGSVYLYPPPSTPLTTLAGLVTTVYPTHTTDAEALQLPPAYHVLPCYFAIAEAYEVDNEASAPQKADRWRMKYEKGLAEMEAQVQRAWQRSRPTSPPSYL
jgi:hypothetical protein